jgi:hypothetical protein
MQEAHCQETDLALGLAPALSSTETAALFPRKAARAIALYPLWSRASTSTSPSSVKVRAARAPRCPCVPGAGSRLEGAHPWRYPSSTSTRHPYPPTASRRCTFACQWSARTRGAVPRGYEPHLAHAVPPFFVHACAVLSAFFETAYPFFEIVCSLRGTRGAAGGGARHQVATLRRRQQLRVERARHCSHRGMVGACAHAQVEKLSLPDPLPPCGSPYPLITSRRCIFACQCSARARGAVPRGSPSLSACPDSKMFCPFGVTPNGNAALKQSGFQLGSLAGRTDRAALAHRCLEMLQQPNLNPKHINQI